MISDEERMAIKFFEKLREFKVVLSCSYWNNGEFEFNNTQKEQFDIILNLIEKQSKEIEDLKKKPMFLIKDIYSPKLKEINLQDVEGLIEQGREEIKDKIKAKIEWLDKEGYFEFLSNRDILKCHNILASLLEKE